MDGAPGFRAWIEERRAGLRVWTVWVEKQIPPLRVGMTNKRAFGVSKRGFQSGKQTGLSE
jgi:hypothetical protein